MSDRDNERIIESAKVCAAHSCDKCPRLHGDEPCFMGRFSTGEVARLVSDLATRLEAAEGVNQRLLEENSSLNVTADRLRGSLREIRDLPRFRPEDAARPTIDDYLNYLNELPQNGHNMLGHVLGCLAQDIQLLEAAESRALSTEQGAAVVALVDAGKRIQYSDRVTHGLRHENIASAWGDIEKCDLCAVRAALADPALIALYTRLTTSQEEVPHAE